MYMQADQDFVMFFLVITIPTLLNFCIIFYINLINILY